MSFVGLFTNYSPGFEIFDSGIFLGSKNLASIFRGGLFKVGIFGGITDLGCVVLRIMHSERKCSWMSDYQMKER